MKITVIQQKLLWADPKGNVQRADEAINRNVGADLYVFPEMFSTGFCMYPENIANIDEEYTLAWMQHKAQTVNAALAASIIVREEDRFYNRFYFVKPDGEIKYYNKRHLFTYGGEHERYTAGTDRVIVEYRGNRILLQICYDLRFPVWARNCQDYDLILYVANWPSSRIDVWDILLKARAIENQCYVVGVNRVGTDPYCEYSGGSVIISPYGKLLAKCEDNCEGETTAEIDIKKLVAFRKKFPVLTDADDFEIIIK